MKFKYSILIFKIIYKIFVLVLLYKTFKANYNVEESMELGIIASFIFLSIVSSIPFNDKW